jgi:hypothetical protein
MIELKNCWIGFKQQSFTHSFYFVSYFFLPRIYQILLVIFLMQSNNIFAYAFMHTPATVYQWEHIFYWLYNY